MTTRHQVRRPGGRLRLGWSTTRGHLAFVLAVTAVAWPPAGLTAGARAGGQLAVLEGVVAEPEGSGARIQVLLSGPFHYMVSHHEDRVVVALDGVVAEAAVYHVPTGPVAGIAVRPARDHPGRVDVVIMTRTPLGVAESLLDERALVLRLASSKAAEAGRSTHPRLPAAAPGPDGTGWLRSSQPAQDTPLLAGRAVIPRALRIEAGSGQLIQVDGLMRVAVSDPEVLGTVPVSSRELLVTGRAAGRTTMYVWEGAGRLLAYAVDVLPAEDRIAGLQRLLSSLFPRADITVRELSVGRVSLPPRAARPGDTPYPGSEPASLPGLASAPAPLPPPARPALPAPPPSVPPAPQASRGGAGIVLSGAVETQMDRQRAEDVARAFAPGVVNLLVVRHPVQLKLQVEVVELSRSALRTLGIAWGGGEQTPGTPPSLNGGVYNLQLITSPGVGTTGLDLLIAQIQALTQHGLARLLAEPSLVVLAGRTASLLLGGQVPIPVAGPNGSVTIEYRDFGVILNAHPEYQDDGRVFMQIAPEVSTLDFANAIKVSGFTIPALRVRRAQTEVSMRPAETLVVGGLLQQQDADLVQKIPVLGDLPIIGPLFRSKTFQRQETDLVIFVTPVLVEPGGGAPPQATP